MKNTMQSMTRSGLTLAAAAASMLALAGCTAVNPSSAVKAPASIAGPALHGSVFGGRSPINGASIYLYKASTSGYGALSSNILTSTVTTNANGGFDITGDYTCSAGDQMLLVSVGGDTGGYGSSNPNAVLLAGMGDCLALMNTGFIRMNEVTTVATAFALAPFMTAVNNLQSTGEISFGSSSGNTDGLARAMASVNKLVNVNTGYAGGPLLDSHATAPLAEIYTIANIVAACVNTPTGGNAGDTSTTCGKLFNYATPTAPGSPAAPTDTVGLVLMLAHYPTQRVNDVFNLEPAVSPYYIASMGTYTPGDWTMSVKYAPTGLSTPTSTTIDGSGRVWVTNSGAGSNSVTILNQSGVVATTLTGNGLATPNSVAIDSSGNGWITNHGDGTSASTVSAFTSTGSAVASSPFSVGIAPSDVAFDASGNLYVANTGSKTITELSSAGGFLNSYSTGAAAPTVVIIDPH